MADDRKQIGLTPVGEEALQRIMDNALFASQTDAYRFAIAYSIGMGLDFNDAPTSNYGTKFNAAGGLEDGNLRRLIVALGLGDAVRPYVTAERLAELGIVDIARRLSQNETLSSIIQGLSQGRSPA